jgi:CheY-like chemotaxis protein/anti-sigma regulatory factor (Ser/Thr protein kinase)
MYSAQKAIDSILNNLINNAIKFTNEGGVEVRISEEQNAILKGKTQDLLLIEIEDTGIGIDEKDFENIFLEFRQASEGFSRGYEGTGLGLSLIKRYSDMLGWEISVKSQLGVGSIFSVKIPLNQNPSEKTNKPEMATETEKDKDTNAIGTINNIKFNKDVLVVEDDEISRQLVSVLLRNLCNVDFATNAKEAIETSQKKQYSLVLMDINLGKGENGIYVTQQIKQKENYKNIPFIAMTAFALKGDKEEFLKVGCDDYISKPFDNQLFKDLIEKYLR